MATKQGYYREKGPFQSKNLEFFRAKNKGFLKKFEKNLFKI
jgi:hypothetical protein